jgi:hypothetical protein
MPGNPPQLPVVPTELHICAGLNACKGQGKSGGNMCAGTGDCATAVNSNCHGNNNCRGQGACGGGGSLGSQQTGPGENLCRGKGSCYVLPTGIEPTRVMKAALVGSAGKAIPGIYEGRHVWQVARLLFEQRMIASGRTYTNNSTNSTNFLGGTPSANSNTATGTIEYLYFGDPPADRLQGLPSDEPVYASETKSYTGSIRVGRPPE